ncbi:MAG: MBL fold metallo-hydrolase [Hyphomonadaceae bacterium]|nr:MBL fold metallo-hydrolase [Hyphomonadaceae bacterium]
MRGWIWPLAIVAILAGAAAAAFHFRADIATSLVARAAQSGLSANLPRSLPDGLHAAFCGTGSPLPDRSRAGPCLTVIAGERVFVFDAGEGAAETISLMGIPQGDIEAVFLTHLHSDHFDGLAPLALQHWAAASATQPMLVVGPTGTLRVTAGLNEAYGIDSSYRAAHHGPEIMPPGGAGMRAQEFTIPAADGEMITLVDDGGVRILAFRVDHAPADAVGYRIEYGGRSIVISGDTARSQSLAMAAQGADLLVHEVIAPELDRIMHDAADASGRENVAVIFTDIMDYHTSPEDAGAVAAEAQVGALALTHFLPQTPIPGLVEVFVRDARRTYDGPIYAMRDGDVISLPSAGGIRRSHQLRF